MIPGRRWIISLLCPLLICALDCFYKNFKKQVYTPCPPGRWRILLQTGDKSTRNDPLVVGGLYGYLTAAKQLRSHCRIFRFENIV